MDRRPALLWVIVACALKKKTLENKKRLWIKPRLRHRHTLGNNTQLFQELSSNNAEDLEASVRMPVAAFLAILNRVYPYISRRDTHMRESIPPGARLEVTLLFLASGQSFGRLKHKTQMSAASISILVPEVCRAVYKAFNDEYLKTPSSPEEWLAVAKGFETRLNFPHCVGAIGGRHVPIATPRLTANFMNFVGTHSIPIVAVVNSNYEFIYVDVGTSGRVSDKDIWTNCPLASKLAEDDVGLPNEDFLPNSQKEMPYVFVGGDGIRSEPNILKKFPVTNEQKERLVFNYRLSRATRVVENVFGVLANKFHVFLYTLRLSPEKAGEIVMCCSVLHNFLRREYTDEYTPVGLLDVENTEDCTLSDGEGRQAAQLLPLKNSSGNNKTEAKVTRNEFMEYFNKEGAVPWQDEMIKNKELM